MSGAMKVTQKEIQRMTTVHLIEGRRKREIEPNNFDSVNNPGSSNVHQESASSTSGDKSYLAMIRTTL